MDKATFRGTKMTNFVFFLLKLEGERLVKVLKGKLF